MNPSVAIIIVNWNSYDMTSQCLESLRAIAYNNYEIVVADNGSSDQSGDDIKNNFPEITLLKNEKNEGFTGGNNLGIRYAINKGFDYLLLLNNDTVVTSDFLNVLIYTIDSLPKVGAIQPKIMFNKERDVIWSAGGIFNDFLFLTKTRGENELDLGQYDIRWRPEWITGCCFLVRTEIIKQIGPLDEKFFIYFEDSDWSFKIRNAGFELMYEPEAVIYHEVGMSNRNRSDHNEGNISPFSHYVNIRNHLYMVRRYAKGVNKLGAWSYQMVKFVSYVLYFLARRRFVKLRYTLRGFRDGLTQ
tara:strand:+ start:3676 stop:4578 length:903 start_codon:yes stop_codon:yes gene_type:complete